METTPLLKSQVIRAVIVALLGLAGIIARKLGYSFDDDFQNQLADAILLIVTTIATAWAGWARATKPTPPLTQTAAAKTEAVEAAKMQGGFARPAVLGVAFVLGLGVLGAAGCVGTRDAYKAAGGDPVKTAYVVGEHYAAVVKEAAALKNSGQLTGSALEAVRKADDAVRPLIIGNSATGTPGLRQLSDAYVAVKSADNLAALDKALTAAVEKLTDLINALKRR